MPFQADLWAGLLLVGEEPQMFADSFPPTSRRLSDVEDDHSVLLLAKDTLKLVPDAFPGTADAFAF